MSNSVIILAAGKGAKSTAPSGRGADAVARDEIQRDA